MMGENTSEWYDISARLKVKAAEFKKAYDNLVYAIRLAEKNPSLAQEGRRLLTIGNNIRDKVLTVTSSIDNAYGWFKSSVGLSGMVPDNNLGILPLIPLAVAGASVAAMTKFVSSVYIYIDKVNRFDALVKKYGVEKALEIMSRLAPSLDSGKSITDSIIGGLIPILVVGGGILYLMKRR